MNEHRGHLFAGLTTMHTDGVCTDDVFFPCAEVDALPWSFLARAHRESKVYPPLDACGYQHPGASNVE